MPKNTDDAKGQLKETAGDVTGDDDLKGEGKADQAKGAVKDVVDSAKDAASSVKDKATGK